MKYPPGSGAWKGAGGGEGMSDEEFSVKVLPYKICGHFHEKFDFLENTRFKTLEHLLKAF